ncbi:MAG: biotin/lipoyl-binding protein [Phycisphaerales bacterium]
MDRRSRAPSRIAVATATRCRSRDFRRATCSSCRKPVAAAPPPPEVLVVEATTQDVPVVQEWIGSADGYVNAVIRPQVSGYLQQQNYKEGEFVKQGAVLFTIDPRPFRATLDQSVGQLGRPALLGKATIDVDRYTPLAAQSRHLAAGARQRHPGQEGGRGRGRRAATAAVESGVLNLGFTKVTSLIDGIAGIANAQVGNLIDRAKPRRSTTVSTVDPIKVYFPSASRTISGPPRRSTPTFSRAPRSIRPAMESR